jgi:RNA recognition motif-containing protein
LHDPSRNRGFLFVEYYNHACADYARQKLSSPDFKVDGSQLTVSWAEPKGSTSSSSSDSSSAAQVNNVACKTELSCLFDVYIMYPYSLQLADLLKHVYNFVLIVILPTLLVEEAPYCSFVPQSARKKHKFLQRK